MSERYRKFRIEMSEFEGRKAAYYFEWLPKFIKGAPRKVIEQELDTYIKEVKDFFLKELFNPHETT